MGEIPLVCGKCSCTLRGLPRQSAFGLRSSGWVAVVQAAFLRDFVLLFKHMETERRKLTDRQKRKKDGEKRERKRGTARRETSLDGRVGVVFDSAPTRAPRR